MIPSSATGLIILLNILTVSSEMVTSFINIGLSAYLGRWWPIAVIVKNNCDIIMLRRTNYEKFSSWNYAENSSGYMEVIINNKKESEWKNAKTKNHWVPDIFQ